MQQDSDQKAWLTLLRTPRLGARGLRELLAHHADIHAVLDRVRRHGVAGGGERARGWVRAPDRARLQGDAEWLARPSHRLLRCTDADFPPQLERMPDPPAALFVAGDASALLRPQVAVVGARNASPGGRRNAAAFSRALALRGLGVTSGLAEGIDAAAHEAALEVAGATVAVVGTGPDRVYPRRHDALAAAIAEQGVLVSEFPPGTPARPGHFPRRNRIIAGLALGTLVVEAGLRSGSLITARLAAEAGREVFALPGSIHHPLARGCHRLIRDGACLVEEVDEMIEALAPLARALGTDLRARLGKPVPAVGGHGASPGGGDAESARILEAMGYDPASMDELCERCGLDAATVSPALLMLELEGVIASLPGGRYQRL
jgi:DNA processing protein